MIGDKIPLLFSFKRASFTVMADAKIEIKAGGAEFSATGTPDWVTKQLDKFFDNASKIASISRSTPDDGGGGGKRNGQPDKTLGHKTLATHLKEKGASTNQTKKFLQTAIWLESKGKKEMTTADVTKALKDAHQSRLANPADCLNKNVNKGYCEKEGKQFYVTEEGRNAG